MAAAAECEDGPRLRIMDASRRLFDAKGFHSASIAELAAQARVSVGQIYRFFPGKNEIIVAIAEEDAQAHLRGLEEIFAAVEAGGMPAAEAIELFAYNALTRVNEGLWFEILAESYRNPRVAEMARLLSDRYRDLVRRLAFLARPELSEPELEACVEIMTACFHGFGLRFLARSAIDARALSHTTACLILRGLNGRNPATAGSAPGSC